jgi:hypothetical protein
MKCAVPSLSVHAVLAARQHHGTVPRTCTALTALCRARHHGTVLVILSRHCAIIREICHNMILSGNATLCRCVQWHCAIVGKMCHHLTLIIKNERTTMYRNSVMTLVFSGCCVAALPQLAQHCVILLNCAMTLCHHFVYYSLVPSCRYSTVPLLSNCAVPFARLLQPC